MKNLTLLIAFLLGGMIFENSAHAQAYVPLLEVGFPWSLNEVQLHVKGQPINVLELAIHLHRMNSPVQNYLNFQFYLQEGSPNVKNCQFWYNQVVKDSDSSSEAPYPYLQVVNNATYNQVMMSDEGDPIIPKNLVQCWEARDMYPQY
jgi:hypothetical protein